MFLIMNVYKIRSHLNKQSKDLSKRVTSKKVNLYTHGKVTYVCKLLFYSFTEIFTLLLNKHT